MASIPITTTQNVTIDYQTAGVVSRAKAFGIDLLIIFFWYLINYFISASLFEDDNLYLIIVILPVISFYTLIFEFIWNGQTPGKRVMGIRVMKLNGREPEFIDYFTRWSLRFVEIYLSAGVIAGIMISTTNLQQRLGDIIAGTIMVNVWDKYSITTDVLSNINSQANYQPKYPEVASFTEAEMLVLKKLVDRHQRYRNAAHRELMLETANRISRKLGIEILENKPDLFIKTLIKDYVVLTR